MTMVKKRNVAYKLWISQIFNGTYIKQNADLEPSYLEYEGKRISRVNIIATVINVFTSDDGNYAALTIDDGSHQIRLKTWGDDTKSINEIKPGALVMVIGRLKEYNNEIYITPEIVKPLNDFNWEIARKLELLKEYGFVKIADIKSEIIEPKQQESKKEYAVEERIEPNVSNDTRTVVLDIINKLNSQDGIAINEIKSQSGLNDNEINAIINELVRDGEIYKSKAGIVNLV